MTDTDRRTDSHRVDSDLQADEIVNVFGSGPLPIGERPDGGLPDDGYPPTTRKRRPIHACDCPRTHDQRHPDLD